MMSSSKEADADLALSSEYEATSQASPKKKINVSNHDNDDNCLIWIDESSNSSSEEQNSLTQLTPEVVRKALSPLISVKTSTSPCSDDQVQRLPVNFKCGNQTITARVSEAVLRDPKLSKFICRVDLRRINKREPYKEKAAKSASKTKTPDYGLKRMQRRLESDSSLTEDETVLKPKSSKIRTNSKSAAVPPPLIKRVSLSNKMPFHEPKRPRRIETTTLGSSRSNSPMSLPDSESNESLDLPCPTSKKGDSLLKRTLTLNSSTSLKEKKMFKRLCEEAAQDERKTKSVQAVAEPSKFRIPRLPNVENESGAKRKADQENHPPKKIKLNRTPLVSSFTNSAKKDVDSQSEKKRSSKPPPPPSLSLKESNKKSREPKASILESLLPTTSQIVSTYKRDLKICRSPPPTIEQLKVARNKFNINGPKGSSLFLLSKYVDKARKSLQLNFADLSRTLPPPNVSGAFSPSLDVNTLDQDSLFDLYELMNQSASRINLWEVFGFDCWLRELPPHVRRSPLTAVRAPPLICNQDLLFEWLGSLTFSQGYIFYSHVIFRLLTPYKKIETYAIGKRKSANIHVTFQNDFFVENADTSLEACVSYVLHRSNQQYRSVTVRLHEDWVIENQEATAQKSAPISNTLVVTKDNYDDVREIIKDDQLVDTIYMRELTFKALDQPILSKSQIMRKNLTVVSHENDESKLRRTQEVKGMLRARFTNFFGCNLNPENRGLMRGVEQHRMLSDTEYKRKMTMLKSKKIEIDTSSLFK